MNTLDDLLERVDEGALTADGYDDCIIGFSAAQSGRPSVIVYDTDKVIAKLMSEGMSREEAWEYFEFNISGAYMGENTPIFITKMID
jgi:hypothetical protein